MEIYLDIMKPGDVVTLTPKAQCMPVVQDELRTGRRGTPSWLEKDGSVGRVISYPRREDSDSFMREIRIVCRNGSFVFDADLLRARSGDVRRRTRCFTYLSALREEPVSTSS